MSAQSKSGLYETPTKTASAAPRIRKLSRGVTKSEPNSSSPLQNSRLSVDRSPRSVTSKPTIERRSQKVTTSTDKPQTGVPKSSELQAQLCALQEDLKKAKEQIALIEEENAQAIDERKEAQRVAEEANEKLTEALVAQKRAEEESEIEKFRTVELEAGIEAAQKKEEEWQKEIEDLRNQHALDVAALHSTTRELQRAKEELSMTCDAKNQALSHADDATKIAEIHVEKAEILSAELARLKALLNSKLQTEANETNEIVLKLKSEIDSLKQELEKARNLEEKLMDKEACLEELNVELEAAKIAESYARNLAEEWKVKVVKLEKQVEEAKRLERSASESLESVMKQLEGNNDLLHNAESDIDALTEKVGLLEMTIKRQKGELEESENCLDKAKEEISQKVKEVESLKSELETVTEEKAQALNNEKLAASSVQNLLEEKNKLINELGISREEEEKSKKAMESLASALHEVSAEAREAKERLLKGQAEHESYENQIEDLKMVLKATNEKYKNMLDDAKHEINILTDSLKQSKIELQNTKLEWEQKELHLVNCVKETEEVNSSLGKEVNRLVNLLKETEDEVCAIKEEEAQLKESLKEVEAEVIYLQETLGEAKAQSVKLQESLLDKENELQSISQENEEFRAKEAASFKKVGELSKLLEEAMNGKQALENGELTDSEKDYDLLPKVVEFSEANGHTREDQTKMEAPPEKCEEPKEKNSETNVLNDEAVHMAAAKIENVNGGKPKEDANKKKVDDSVKIEYKMWESCKIEKKEFSPERETEQDFFEEEVDSKMDGAESIDQVNGLASTESIGDGESSPSSQQQQKKKKPLLRKFGSLLKKKGASNLK
ncbi:DUF827 domain-containing protein [Cephalotus follicularis]|uniref:DUF827 domain-containing protein n=1 Tax=Cephalotus follicularis TaxID=3775 RepID=A0A1Q3BPS6_CEPFO|nr:DUF827 domain-containing protein [Cephalotus follicularis]